jgi:hypothetical protein
MPVNNTLPFDEDDNRENEIEPDQPLQGSVAASPLEMTARLDLHLVQAKAVMRECHVRARETGASMPEQVVSDFVESLDHLEWDQVETTLGDLERDPEGDLLRAWARAHLSSTVYGLAAFGCYMELPSSEICDALEHLNEEESLLSLYARRQALIELYPEDDEPGQSTGRDTSREAMVWAFAMMVVAEVAKNVGEPYFHLLMQVLGDEQMLHFLMNLWL